MKQHFSKACTNFDFQGGPQAADDEEEYALFGKRTIRKKEKSRAKISRGTLRSFGSTVIGKLIIMKSTEATKHTNCSSRPISSLSGDNAMP